MKGFLFKKICLTLLNVGDVDVDDILLRQVGNLKKHCQLRPRCKFTHYFLFAFTTASIYSSYKIVIT